MEWMEEFDKDRVLGFVKEGSRYLLSFAAVITLELIVYEAKGWRQEWLWWVSTFPLTGAWTIAPYAGLELLLNRRKLTLRQEIIHLLCAVGIIAFGLLIFLGAFFPHVSSNSRMLYLLIPIYQWIGILGAWAISYAICKTLD